MRVVHELEYLQDDALPALIVAAEDGDWQVRMAAVHALGPLSPRATPVLRYLLRHEPCPVVRLIALHELGSQLPSADEEKALGWMFSARGDEVNDCRDQPAPGRAPWAVPQRPAAPAATVEAPRPTTPRAPAPPAPEPAESDEEVVTPDVPARPAPAAPAAPTAPAASVAPTKDQRLAELDSLLAGISLPARTPAAGRADYATAPARSPARGAVAGRRAIAPESMPVMPPAPAGEERAAAKGPAFQDAGGKAPHDPFPDLLQQLRAADARARARAADDLGSRGEAAAAAVPDLIAALADRSPRVRASASLALGNIGTDDRRVVPLLVRELRDKSQDVRYAATLALSRMRTPAAAAAFRTEVNEDARRAIERTRR